MSTLARFAGQGCYLYEYMTDESKQDETELLPKSAVYNCLICKELDNEQYEHAKQLWTKRGMTTLHDWYRFYLQLDVLLFADVFQAFTRTMINMHGLDCLHFPGLPSMMLQLTLKVNEVELELITDPDIYLMIKSGICRALSYVAQFHTLANFPWMPDYRADLPTLHLLYLNCNSLYTTCETYPLPVGGFCFLMDAELLTFDIASVPTRQWATLSCQTSCTAQHPSAGTRTRAHRQRDAQQHDTSDGGCHQHRSISVHEIGLEPVRQDALCHVLSLPTVLSHPRTMTGQDTPRRCILSACLRAAIHQILQQWAEKCAL